MASMSHEIVHNAALTGRVAVIVGAARGIGAAIARALSADGAAVVAVDRDVRVRDLAEELPRACAIVGDGTDQVKVDAAFRAARELPGRLSVLVYLAYLQRSEPALELSRQTWDDTLEVTLSGAWRWAQRFGSETTDGSIVLISSVQALRHVPDLVAYGTAKAGLAGLAGCLAVAFGSRGIRANAVLPGAIAVERNAWRWEDPDDAVEMSSRNPLGRLGQPEDIANVVAFLASDKAAFVNGTCIPVDGGWLKKL